MPVYRKTTTRKEADCLRVADLIAKVAKVSLKDTVRVLMSLDTVADFMDQTADDILAMDHSIVKPTEGEAAFCSQAYADLEDYLRDDGAPDWLDTIRSTH